MSEISTTQKVIMTFGGVSLVAFFLGWVNHSAFVDATTGYDLATTTSSSASGSNLTMLFVTPIAAVGIVALALFVARLGRWAPTGQALLAIAAIVAPLMIVPNEIDSWTGGEVTFAFGLWVTLFAMGAIVIAASVDQFVRFKESNPEQEFRTVRTS